MRVKNIASPLVSVMSNRMLQSFYYVEFNYGYKKKTPLAGGYFTILRDIHVAPQLKTVLVLALKFCLQPTLQPPELTGLPRKMAYKINKKNSIALYCPCHVAEYVDALWGTNIHPIHTYNTRPLILFLDDNNLPVLEADKEWSYVLMPKKKALYWQNLCHHKNFKQVQVSLKRVKGQALQHCDRSSLTQCLGTSRKQQGLTLRVSSVQKTQGSLPISCHFQWEAYMEARYG